jgi:hypothetical protein
MRIHSSPTRPHRCSSARAYACSHIAKQGTATSVATGVQEEIGGAKGCWFESNRGSQRPRASQRRALVEGHHPCRVAPRGPVRSRVGVSERPRVERAMVVRRRSVPGGSVRSPSGKGRRPGGDGTGGVPLGGASRGGAVGVGRRGPIRHGARWFATGPSRPSASSGCRPRRW